MPTCGLSLEKKTAARLKPAWINFICYAVYLSQVYLTGGEVVKSLKSWNVKNACDISAVAAYIQVIFTIFAPETWPMTLHHAPLL